MCLSSSEFLMYLMSRVRHSEASRFLTLEYIGQVGVPHEPQRAGRRLQGGGRPSYLSDLPYG